MYSIQTELKNVSGLHARPASEFVAMAKKFQSAITVQRLDDEDAKPVNAKSIIKILAQGIGVGTPIEIAADGPDENEAVEQLLALVESKFGED
ncbi:MAG: HPr family phosphocarrier protein [Chloroflexi bacterium]|jgi:phosphocarrier protein|nr:HPr family phosphocarrier protein [Chloroflexota bacterium]